MNEFNESCESTSDRYTTTQIRPYKKADVLKELYVERDLSQYQIADRYDVTQPTVWYWLDHHDIEKFGKVIGQ